MLVSVPTDQDVTIDLCAKLRTLPTLIEVYVLIVDQVLRKHGFDSERCKFLVEQALPPAASFQEDSVQSSLALPEASRIGPNRADAAGWSQLSDSIMSCEEDLLAIAG